MSASAVFILDVKGRVLISRDYRGDIPASKAERFLQKLLEVENESELPPMIYDEGVTYTYVQHNK